MLTYRHAIGVLARFASSLVRADLQLPTCIIQAKVDKISSNTKMRFRPRLHTLSCQKMNHSAVR